MTTGFDRSRPGKPGLRAPKLSDRIADELIGRIVRGDIQIGDALPSEEDLATEFDVSRPVVREAVKELAVIGLVQSRQGRSTRVAPAKSWNQFDPRLLYARSEIGAVDSTLLELLELRRLVEVGAAGLAATRREQSDLEVMASAITEMRKASSASAYTDGDIRFHDAILRATGNDLLVHLIDLIGPLLRVGRQLSVARRPDGRVESLREHEAIMRAIRDEDVERARQEMREHLSWTANLKLDD